MPRLIMRPIFPKCDNCGKSIRTHGKYINRNGKRLYVHLTYNEILGEC